MKNKKNIILSLITVLFFSFGFVTLLNAQTVNSTLNLGSRGTDVTNLQSFLATNSLIYPQGLVTGYYGPLTKEAVTQFQISYNLPAVGIFGPQTLERMRSVMISGLGLDISAPVLSSVTVQTSNNQATLSWLTNTLANGKIYYDTKPLTMFDAQTRFTAPSISGTTAMSGVTNTSQSITLTNLSPGTVYYYVVQSTDAAGNVSVSWPSTFVTTI